MKRIELRPVTDPSYYFEKMAKRIKLYFRRLVYEPLLVELDAPKTYKLANTKFSLTDALRNGRVTYDGNAFSGRFNAEVTKELKALGAKWDAKVGVFRIPSSSLPFGLRQAIAASQETFLKRLATVDKKLSQLIPEKIAESINLIDLFDSSLWKTDREINRTLASISSPPELTPERRKKIAAEWQNNMELWIKDFAAEEIAKLRKAIQDKTFSGYRYGSAVREIQRSYGVTAAKAKFLARQETHLLLAKFKETRYTEANVHEYRWRCVVGSALHPVRPSHKILDGKFFKWSDPPITTAPDEPTRRNNPGQDYNCRCQAIPAVRFNEGSG